MSGLSGLSGLSGIFAAAIPALPTANLQALYIGDNIQESDISYSANNADINTWPDASGNGNHITSVNPKPDITARNSGGNMIRRAGLNGHSGVRFTGHHLPYPATIDKRNFAVFWVGLGWRFGRQSSVNTASGAALFTFASGPAMFWSGSHALQRFVGGNQSSGFRPMDQPMVYGLVGTATELTFYLGDKSATLTALTAGTSTTAQLGNDTYSLDDFSIYELAVYSSSSVDVAAIKAYFANKYALGHAWYGRVAFVGDSLTRGFDGMTDPPLDCYPYQTLRLLGDGWHGTNASVSGTQVDAMTTDAATNVDPYYDATNYTKNVCVLWGGTNDLYFGASAATTISRIQTYCAARKSAGWKVVLCTLTPRSSGGTPGSFEADRQTVNTAIRAMTPTYADAIADLAANTTIGDAGDETNATYYSDLVHMTPAGYAIVAGIVKAAILTV